MGVGRRGVAAVFASVRVCGYHGSVGPWLGFVRAFYMEGDAGSRPTTADSSSRPTTAGSKGARPTTAGSSATKASSGQRKKKKKKKKKKQSKSDSDESDDSSSSDSSSGSGSTGSSSDSEDGENSTGKQTGPSDEELRAEARAKALEEIDSIVEEYKYIRMYVQHFIDQLKKRGVDVPTVHLVPEVSRERFLAKLEWEYKDDEPRWMEVLHKWKTEHLRPAHNRLGLLRQREHDKKGKYSNAFTDDTHERKQIKAWESALLHGIGMDQLEAVEKKKRDALAKERRLLAARRKEEREKELAAQTQGAMAIQGLWRKRKARKNIQMMLMDRYEKVYDVNQEQYYYYDKVKCTTQWNPPAVFNLFHVELDGVY